MKGISITNEVNKQFEERILFLNKKLNELQDQFKQANTIKNNAFNTHENLKFINPNWKMQKLIFLNELTLRKEFLKDSTIIE